MLPYKKIAVTSGLFALTLIGIAASKPFDDEKRNLKVLPKNIGDDELDLVMSRFERQLGVSCTYCHVNTKPEIFPKRMDFASDEKPEKEIARKMLRMTIKLNKKYFGIKDEHQAIMRPKLSCKTCHNGFPRPL